MALGRIAWRDDYPQLTESERDEREEFVVEACRHMRERFNQRDVWVACPSTNACASPTHRPS